MTLNQIIEILTTGEKAKIKQLMANRAIMSESKLRMVGELLSDYPEVSIEFNPMSQANEYIISRNGQFMATQFYWREGHYDAQGNHSLYDEYGMDLK